MMFVVVFKPYQHQVPEDVGPFRSEAKAMGVMDRIVQREESGGFDVGLVPTVVPLLTEAEAHKILDEEELL